MTTVGNRLVDTRLGGYPRYYLVPQWDINMRVPDVLRQCVVFVGLPQTNQDGHPALAFKGTAFFVSVPSQSGKGNSYVYMITAKHVSVRLEGKPFLVRSNTKDGGSILVEGKGAKWWYHPTDSSVDVAVIPWAPPEPIEYKHIPIEMFLTDQLIHEKNIGTGDEVFITGLFAHLTGSKRNLPIVRIGNIAMMPDEPVPTETSDIEAYLIEARSIGGLSGSPVFVRETVEIGIGSFYLLGLMHGHWDIPPEKKNDEVLMNDDLLGKVNMGIAIVVPAEKILEVLNQPELRDMRHRTDEKIRREAAPTPDESIKVEANEHTKPAAIPKS